MRARQIKFTSLTAILSLTLATLGFTATPANAADAFSLTYSGTTELTVTGHTGAWPTTIDIPAQVNGVPVVAIGDNAFFLSPSSTITMHEGIRYIGKMAFFTANIGNIEFPASLGSLGAMAFQGIDFATITFDGNRNSITTDAFDGISSETKIYVYEDATGFIGTWGNSSVYRMTHFKYSITNDEVTITGYGGNAPSDLLVPSSIEGRPVVGLADGALANLGITSVKLPSTLKTIGDSALVGNFLSSVVIPPSVTRIGNWAFSFNPNLTTVTLQGNAPTVGFDPWVMTNQNLTYLNVYDTATGYGAQWAGHDIHVIGAPSSEATLSLLAPARGSFNETYSPTTYSYTMNVAGTVDSLQVLPNPENQFATVKINGTSAQGWALSDPIALAVGQTTITVEVTAQDTFTTHTYTLVVTRATPPSNDATLSALSVSSGSLTPVFSASSTDYTVNVPYTQTSASITPTRNESHATITVNGNAVPSGTASGSLNLSVGNNSIPVVVTAEDGTQKTYTVYFVRAAASNNANLSAMEISTGSLAQTFASGTTDYTVSYANGVSSVKVTPTLADSTATLKVNGATVVSGHSSGDINLAVGATNIAVVVTAQDGGNKTYTIRVTRAAPVVLSKDSTLSGIWLAPVAIDTNFDPGTFSYHAVVPFTISKTDLTATGHESHATLTLNGKSVTSGATAHELPLAVGMNEFDVVVLAQDGTTTTTYSIFIERMAASSNATLSTLTVSAGNLKPGFKPELSYYSLSVANNVSSVQISATVADAGASVTLNNASLTSGMQSAALPLSVGDNTFTLRVVSQSGSTIDYVLAIKRLPKAVITKPYMTGDAHVRGNNYVNGTLTVYHPKLNGSPATLSYKWYRCTQPLKHSTGHMPKIGSCIAIPNATKNKYKVSKADQGRYIVVEFKAMNKAGALYSTPASILKTR